MTADANAAPYVQRWHTALEEGPSLRCPDPEALQVRRPAPAVTVGQPQTVKVPGACTREAGLDRALVKDSVGTYRRDGQDRALPTSSR